MIVPALRAAGTRFSVGANSIIGENRKFLLLMGLAGVIEHAQAAIAHVSNSTTEEPPLAGIDAVGRIKIALKDPADMELVKALLKDMLEQGVTSKELLARLELFLIDASIDGACPAKAGQEGLCAYLLQEDGTYVLYRDGEIIELIGTAQPFQYAQAETGVMTDAGAASASTTSGAAGAEAATTVAGATGAALSVPVIAAIGLGALGVAAAAGGGGGGGGGGSSAIANSAPTAVALSASTVAENAAGAVIGNLTVTDPDAGDTHAFSVNDGRFEVVAGQLKLKAGVSLDHEAATTVNVTVTATDAGGLSKAQAFTIQVSDVDESTPPPGPSNNAPTSVNLSASTVAENAAGAVIGNLTVTDPDAGDTHAFSVNDGRFEVVAGQLKLKAGVSLDHEAAATVNVTVTATDAGGLSKAQAFTIQVSDVDESTPPPGPSNNAPTSVNLSASTVAENTAGAVIGNLTVTDPDAGDTHTFSVNDGRFEVVAGQLKLKAGVSLDHEAAATVNVTVTATDAGGLSKAQAFAITVTDVAETTTLTGTAGADTFNHASGLDDFIITGLAGNDTITTGSGNDIVRPGEGVDTVNTGAGNDIVVVVGQTAIGQYDQSDINNPGGSGINLSGVVTLADLNGRTLSEVQPGENIDGGAGTNRLVIYGTVDFTGVTLANITQFQVNSTLTITAQQLNALGLTLIFGDGESVINILNPSGAPVTVDLSGVSFSDFKTLNLGANVTLIVDQADVADLLYLTGSGALRASDASGTLNLAGKYTTLAIQDKDGAPQAGHGATVVSGDLLIASEAGESLTGGTGDDRLIGGDGNDILNGGDGNDILRGGKGVDEMHGGAGDDRFVIVGDLSGGGKIDSAADTDVLGFPLTTLNGKTFGEDVGGGVIRGGEGNDTLYVFGTADLSDWDIEGIENIEIRSDVKFTKAFFDKNVVKTINGDGSSTLRIVSDTPITLDLAALDAFKLSGIGSIELGSNVTLEVTSLDQLGGARILTGTGKIEAKSGNLDLSGYTKTTGLKVKNADGSDTTGGEVLENAISRGKDGVYRGTNGDDYMKGSAVKDTFVSGNGADVMLGDAGDDTYVIDGTGKKIILDTAGTDTLDLSKLTTGANVDLSNGGTAGATTIELGSGAGRAPIDLMILQDLSGSFGDDVPTVKALLDNLFAGVRGIHSDSRFGASAFVDKPIEPFGDAWSGDYVYKTWQTITNDTAAVKTAFNNMQVLYGGDGPESQLEAIYQVALRTIADDATPTTTGDEIGYRPGSMRVVVLTTDANYHVAGHHASAGPNNGNTILDGTPPGTGEDYPTVAAVKEALAKANIYPIFAVTSGNNATYESLVTQLGRGDVVPLSSNSSNLISSIQTGLTNYKQDFIENLIGNDFSDELTGNSLNNRIEGGKGDDVLKGMGGNDILIGGDGIDTAVFRGNKADYSFNVMSKVGDTAWLRVTDGVSGRDGADVLSYSIEKMLFEGNGEVMNIIDYLKGLDPDAVLRTAEDIFEYYDKGSSVQDNFFKFFFDLSRSSYFFTSEHVAKGVSTKIEMLKDGAVEEVIAPHKILDGTSIKPLGIDARGIDQAYAYLTNNKSLHGMDNFDDLYLEGKGIYVNSTKEERYFDYKFDDGWYIAVDNEAAITRSSVALLTKSEDGKTLFLSFRGSETAGDWIDDFLDMKGHFSRYQPLFEALSQYVKEFEVKKIYVTGHSLGGQMASEFMRSNPDGFINGKAVEDLKYEAVLFEAANKILDTKVFVHSKLDGAASDTRIIAFEAENDLVPDLGFGVNPGKTVHLNVDGFPIWMTMHGMGAFQSAFIRSLQQISLDDLMKNGDVRIYSDYDSKMITDWAYDKLPDLLKRLMPEPTYGDKSISTDGGLSKSLADGVISSLVVAVSLPVFSYGVRLNAIDAALKVIDDFAPKASKILSANFELTELIISTANKGWTGFSGYVDNFIQRTNKDLVKALTESINSKFTDFPNILGELPSLVIAAAGVFVETYGEMLRTGYDIKVANANELGDNKLIIEQIPFAQLLGLGSMTYTHIQGDISTIHIKPMAFDDLSAKAAAKAIASFISPLEKIPGLGKYIGKFGASSWIESLLKESNEYIASLFDQNIDIDGSGWMRSAKSLDNLTIVGNYGNNKLIGSIHNDFIYGGGGDDYIFGGDGDDALFGGGDKNTIVGGKGNDFLYGASYVTSLTDKGLVAYLNEHGKKLSDYLPVKFDEKQENLYPDKEVDSTKIYGGPGFDVLVGAETEVDGGDDDGDNDFFFIDVDVSNNVKNIDHVVNFYVASALSDISSDDYIVFSGKQLGIDISSIAKIFGSGPLDKSVKLSADNFQVEKTIGAKLNYGFAAKEPHFIIAKDDNSIYFDSDGEEDVAPLLVAKIYTHQKSNGLESFDASQILLVEDFSNYFDLV